MSDTKEKSSELSQETYYTIINNILINNSPTEASQKLNKIFQELFYYYFKLIRCINSE